MATIGFIGGTGSEGLGLATRFGLAGETIRIGSRQQQRGDAAAQKVRAVLAENGTTASATDVAGDQNSNVAEECEIAVIVVPFAGHAATLTALRSALSGKLVIDAVVPLTFVRGVPTTLAVPEGSATEQAQALLPGSTVVGAFHNLSARKLADLSTPLSGDVLVTGDDERAKRWVMEMVGRMPDLRGIDAGPLTMSKVVEDMTALLLGINQRYKTLAALQIVGI